MKSHRWTISVGILLMGSGAILSAFGKSAVDLYLSVGLVAGKLKPFKTFIGFFTNDFFINIGSGQGLVTNTVILNLTDHFKTNMGLAFGIAFMIMALAGIVTPQLDNLLLKGLSGQISILVHGIVMLVLGLAGAFFLVPAPKLGVKPGTYFVKKFI